MKKIVVSLFLMVAMLSFSAKKSSAENEIRASFDRDVTSIITIRSK